MKKTRQELINQMKQATKNFTGIDFDVNILGKEIGFFHETEQAINELKKIIDGQGYTTDVDFEEPGINALWVSGWC